MKNKNTVNYTTTDMIRLFEEVSDPGKGYSTSGAYRALGAFAAIVDGHIRYGHHDIKAFEEVFDLQYQINRICEDLKKELAQQKIAA
jgi:hypothetical protein